MTKPPFRNSYVMGSLLSPCRRFSFHFALPAGADRPSLLARLCISSWARTISSSESCAQRRSCSRSAPSQVVRLQSIAFSSLPGIGKLSQMAHTPLVERLHERIEASQLHAGYFALFPCNPPNLTPTRRQVAIAR